MRKIQTVLKTIVPLRGHTVTAFFYSKSRAHAGLSLRLLVAACMGRVNDNKMLNRPLKDALRYLFIVTHGDFNFIAGHQNTFLLTRKYHFVIFAGPEKARIGSARGCSSVGRAQPCQGWGHGFESRHPLHDFKGLVFND